VPPKLALFAIFYLIKSSISFQRPKLQGAKLFAKIFLMKPNSFNYLFKLYSISYGSPKTSIEKIAKTPFSEALVYIPL